VTDDYLPETPPDHLRFPVAPRYRSASLADVMPSVATALGVAGTIDPLGFATKHAGLQRALVLLVDGLGYHQLDAASEASATIADLISGRFGTVDRLTTGFPSTTPASLVSLGTGALPGAHGILGFTVRVPGEDRVLNHIAWTDDPDPAVWQPLPTIFERARAAGVATRVVSKAQFAGGGLTNSAYRGADYIGETGIEPLADAMIDALTEPAGPVIVYGYHPDVDHIGHVHGVGSGHWLDQIRRLERLLARLAARLPGDAALFVTADHGQLNVPWDRRFDLDRDSRLRDGVHLVAGEPRVRYLHVEPGALADVVKTWQGVLGDAAMVMTRDEAITTGWYGEVAPAHVDRIGDVVVICRGQYAVIESVVDPGAAGLIGYHGSLTAAEVEIPLITLRW